MVKFCSFKENWAARDTIEVAQDLLGKLLVRKLDSQNLLVSQIVETEAYLGVEDPACHSFGGRKTPRTQVMFENPGTCYVYFIYGMYHCLNLVTGNGEAVLIRALAPLTGFASDDFKNKSLSGPGKLCRRLAIDKNFNGSNLLSTKEDLFIADPQETEHLLHKDFHAGPRVGIDSAGDAAHWPLRFGLKDSPYLSRPKF